MNGKKIAAATLGCKVNFRDTEAMLELFRQRGWEIVDYGDRADVYMINTCTVTNLGDKKSRQMIRRAKRLNPDAVVAAVGCYAQVAPEEVAALEGVDIVLGVKDRGKIVERIEAYRLEEGVFSGVEDIMTEREFEDLAISRLSDRQRAYIKIQEGCDRFCSYCVIPYARGPVRSRKPEDAVAEIERVAKNGYKEIVLAGIHVASYGKDLGNTHLLDMLRLAHQVEGIERIRMSSIEPTAVTEDFIRALKEMPKICPHFHLSLQSGCGRTLKAMNRKYSPQQYREAVTLLREYDPLVAITTDVIAGFPGETEEDHRESSRFVEELELARLHVFPYSPKKGTPAAVMPHQVKDGDKTRRAEELIKLGKSLEKKFIEKNMGSLQAVLFETQKNGIFEGLTGNYISVGIESGKDLLNQACLVRITGRKGEQAEAKLLRPCSSNVV